MNSHSSAWDRRRDIENVPMACVAEMTINTNVIVAHARTIGHDPILDETYALRRHLGTLTHWLASEHEKAEEQASNGNT